MCFRTGAAVKQLWFFPGLAGPQAALINPAILNACCNMEILACFPDAVIKLCMSSSFRHASLVDVTLMDPIIPWDPLLRALHSSIFFNQIQTLRLIGTGGTLSPAIPLAGTVFRRLAELTVTARITSCLQTYLLDQTQFPSLSHVVVAIPYCDWCNISMTFLMAEPELADGRFCVVHCSKKWKELDVWKQGVFSIWNMGATEWNARVGTNTTGSHTPRFVLIHDLVSHVQIQNQGPYVRLVNHNKLSQKSVLSYKALGRLIEL
jgi:hypothetical protein